MKEKNLHIYDVWNHTKKIFQNSRPDKEIRLALLSHDIGKPHSYQDDKCGIRGYNPENILKST